MSLHVFSAILAKPFRFRFKKVPSCVFEMVGLEIFVLADNQIEELPVERLSKLKRLAVLDVSNNDIGHVPPELGNMKQLRLIVLFEFLEILIDFCDVLDVWN